MGNRGVDEQWDDGPGDKGRAQDTHRADLAMRAEVAVQGGDQDGAVDYFGLSQFGEHGLLLGMRFLLTHPTLAAHRPRRIDPRFGFWHDGALRPGTRRYYAGLAGSHTASYRDSTHRPTCAYGLGT